MSKQSLNYQSPDVQVTDLCAQGVMCQSIVIEDGTVSSLIYDEEEE